MEIKNQDRLWKNALNLKTTVNLDAETSNCDYYTVGKYGVYYHKREKKWTCECHWFAVNGTQCKHILACKLWRRERQKDNANRQDKRQA